MPHFYPETVLLRRELARAKKTGVISALRPHIDKLMEIGAFYDEKLIQLVLKSVGE